ncbi:MAG: hypothetical protein II087_08035 [Muribaculaceae bacterium]|nr:hypothetical protein [Muribaculaceae bacterium]
MTRRLIIALFVLTAALVSSAQEVEWSVDANVVLNNREGGLDESPNQTFIFTRITPQIGVSLDSARHRVMGGVTWFQPMNDNLGGYKVLPALYYQYKNDRKGLMFKFGVIPNELNNTVPTYLRSDSLNYVQPNIKGAALRIDRLHFWFNSWFDWRQMQTNNRREAFDVTGEVGWRTMKNGDGFKASGLVSYNHLATRKIKSPDEGVVDNFIFSPQLTYEHLWANGRLGVSAGVLMTADRDRVADNKWHAQAGFIGKLSGNWKWLSLTENIYAGKRQMPLYEKYGSLVYRGDALYHNKFYSRTDLVATVFKRDFVNLEARLTLHATSEGTAFWQQVAVRFYLDRLVWKRHRHKDSGVATGLLQSQF